MRAIHHLAAQAGKDDLCENAMGATLAECDGMIGAGQNYYDRSTSPVNVLALVGFKVRAS